MFFMKLRISIICALFAAIFVNAGCSAIKGDENSRFRNTNRQAYHQTDPNLPAVAEAPNTGMSWGGSISPR